MFLFRNEKLLCLLARCVISWREPENWQEFLVGFILINYVMPVVIILLLQDRIRGRFKTIWDIGTFSIRFVTLSSIPLGSRVSGLIRVNIRA